MKILLLSLFTVYSSIAIAQYSIANIANNNSILNFEQNDIAGHAPDNELERLPPDVLKNEILRRELALQGIENTKDFFSKELLKATVFYYDKKWDSAYSIYFPLLEKAPDILYGPLVIRIAKCELEMGNIQASRKILLDIKSIKNNKNTWELADQILMEGIMRDSEISQSAKKDSVLQRLKSKPSTKYEPLLRYRLAVMQENEKDTKGAIENYLILLRTKEHYSDSAFTALQRLTPNSENYDFATFFCKKRMDEKCVEKTSAILNNKNSNLDSAKKVNLMVSRAEAWKQLSKTDLAIEQYKKLLDSIDYNSVWMQSLLRMVRSAGNIKEARRLDSIFQRKYPFSTENANNLWVKALEYEQAKDYKNAIDTYKRLDNAKFGKNQRRQWAKFRIGFINFKEKKYEEAANVFAEAAAENLGLMSRSASLYFYAECQRILGHANKAAVAYNAVIADFPLGYYSWRAKQNIIEFNLSENVPKLGKEMSDDSATIWLRALQKKEMSEKDSIVSVERLEQISVLLRSGFEREASILYDEVFKFHKNRPEFYYRYGMMFMQNGEYAIGYRLARNFLDLVPRGKMTDIPIQVLKFLYPLPHEIKVKKHAKIDPFFIYSVMRQESMFDAQIQSPAGARGLLQIMPTTGNFLAKRENIEKFDKSLLFNAYMNIRLGARYLNDLYVEHKKDYIGILGEYNAGPAPTARWLANHGSLPWDIRVEEVSYWETRDYVKRVMGNYWTYKEIYEDKE